MTRWTFEDDRTYHGIQDDEVVNGDGEEPSRIFVELSEYGPTERLTVVELYELKPDFHQLQMGWGYDGSGTSAAGHAILTDAMAGVQPSTEMREAFCEDVLAVLCDEFRLRRGAVLRWARGWCADQGMNILPDILTDLPPVDASRYGPRPPGTGQRRIHRPTARD